MVFCRVDALSDESDSGSPCEHVDGNPKSALRERSSSFRDVTDLTDDEGLVLEPNFQSGGSQPSRCAKKRKRKTISSDFREARTSEKNIKKLLSSLCGKACKRGCFSKIHWLALQKFRQDWLDLHKLDQDQIVASLTIQSADFLLNPQPVLNHSICRPRKFF